MRFVRSAGRSTLVALGGAIGVVACFGVGLAAARALGPAERPANEPTIVISSDQVHLLPDASLHLALPPHLLDAGIGSRP